VFAASQVTRSEVQKQVVEGTILLSRVVRGEKHLIVSAIEFVPVKGCRAALIGRIRLYNHDGRALSSARIAHQTAN
jgi:hypothetical protein